MLKTQKKKMLERVVTLCLLKKTMNGEGKKWFVVRFYYCKSRILGFNKSVEESFGIKKSVFLWHDMTSSSIYKKIVENEIENAEYKIKPRDSGTHILSNNGRGFGGLKGDHTHCY